MFSGFENSNTFKYFFCKKTVSTANASQEKGMSSTEVKIKCVSAVFNRNKKMPYKNRANYIKITLLYFQAQTIPPMIVNDISQYPACTKI